MAQPTYTLEELSRKVDAISEFLNEKTDRNLLNLNTVGQAIIDGKVEVEALLAQNGYAKFTWKEDNKVANLIIQWSNIMQARIWNYPISMSKVLFACKNQGGDFSSYAPFTTITLWNVTANHAQTSTTDHVPSNGYVFVVGS